MTTSVCNSDLDVMEAGVDGVRRERLRAARGETDRAPAEQDDIGQIWSELSTSRKP
jgi:hypothetical protein